MAKSEKNADQYSKEEAQSRFEQALRGARIAGHKTMKEIVGKKPTAQREQDKKRSGK